MKCKVILSVLAFFAGFASFTAAQPSVTRTAPEPAQVPTVTWDRHSLMLDGRRVVPVMGEIHYSRVPENEWQQEIQKMKAGGVTFIATYVFWNHIEEQQGIFDWSGQRCLRRFLELCRQEGLPVCLRIGPYCHGEARCGGIPDWVVSSGCRLRSQDPQFLSYVEALYRQVFTQVQGLQWKDGGPVIACQFDNEYGGDGAYLMALKEIALRAGFDLPFYTRTGWPALRKPTPFGEMIPLYGDYADGFWDRNTTEGSGSYWKAFHFSSPLQLPQGGEAMGALDNANAQPSTLNPPPSTLNSPPAYPYFTCELGGGMMTSYHRRVFLYPEDAYAMALVKLGCGSNLLGYYMYHGGTNPDGHLTDLNEKQRTPVTNHNDLPVKTYDFQAPLGEFGQKYPHYYGLRPLHLFMHDFGELLAPMEATFPKAPLSSPKGETIVKGDDSRLRWSYRTNVSPSGDERGAAAFVFVNNYERFASLSAKRGVQFSVCGVTFPRRPLTIPAGTMTVFPVNLPIGSALLTYATAQPVAQRDGKVWFEQKDGIAAEFCWDGKVRTIKRTSLTEPFATLGGQQLFLITTNQAEHLFLEEKLPQALPEFKVSVSLVHEADPLRTITTGVAKVAEEPEDADFETAAIYRIMLPTEAAARQSLLQIRYRGDVARLYAQGRLIDDNFYNGRPFLYGLWRLSPDVKELELRILPLQADMPVYFPREADTTPGQAVLGAALLPRE